MEQKIQTMLVDVQLVDEIIELLKELQERQQLDVDLDWRRSKKVVHIMEDYLGFAEDYYRTSVSLDEIIKQRKQHTKIWGKNE